VLEHLVHYPKVKGSSPAAIPDTGIEKIAKSLPTLVFKKTVLKMQLQEVLAIHWGARKLTGENLKVVWAEFSTLS
jgi:hypothetical protein